MVVTLGIREFASNDRHVFLEVVVRSWTNSHRNEVELVNRFCMVGPRQAVYMVTAVLVHLAYLVSYYLRWQLYSAVPQFPVFWPSEMTSATFCESSPTVQSRVQSRVQSTEYRRPWSVVASCHAHSAGVAFYREFAKFFNETFSKSNSRKFRPAKYKRHTVDMYSYNYLGNVLQVLARGATYAVADPGVVRWVRSNPTSYS